MQIANTPITQMIKEIHNDIEITSINLISYDIVLDMSDNMHSDVDILGLYINSVKLRL